MTRWCLCQDGWNGNGKSTQHPICGWDEHEDEDEDETSTLMKHYDTTHTDLPFYVIFYILKWIYYTLHLYLYLRLSDQGI